MIVWGFLIFYEGFDRFVGIKWEKNNCIEDHLPFKAQWNTLEL